MLCCVFTKTKLFLWHQGTIFSPLCDFVLHFLLWPSLSNRLLTKQRAKKQLKNRDVRPPVVSALRAIHKGEHKYF